MALSFGVTVLPDPPYTRFLELIELAEANGFDYGWTYDSHVLEPVRLGELDQLEEARVGRIGQDGDAEAQSHGRPPFSRPCGAYCAAFAA